MKDLVEWTKFAEVNNKLDILTNSNMAQILMSQNQSTKEMNENQINT